MKIKFKYIAFLLAVCVALPSRAQPAATNTPTPNSDALRESQYYHFGKLERATRIIGMEVKDSSGQKIGKVKDMAVDLRNGRILEVIVATGGFLGMDEECSAAPPELFTRDPAKKTLHLNVTKARFQSAPPFKFSDWDSDVREVTVKQVYEYYRVKPYFNSLPNHVGDVERVGKLVGTATHNQQDEKLGKIEGLIIDLPAGRVVEIILASGGFLGLGHELSPIPPQSFHPGIHPDILLLDTSKAALSHAPHYKSILLARLHSNPAQPPNPFIAPVGVVPWFAGTNAAGGNSNQNQVQPILVFRWVRRLGWRRLEKSQFRQFLTFALHFRSAALRKSPPWPASWPALNPPAPAQSFPQAAPYQSACLAPSNSAAAAAACNRTSNSTAPDNTSAALLPPLSSNRAT